MPLDPDPDATATATAAVTVTARDVFLAKPFLFRVILLVAARVAVPKQRELRRSVSAYVGQHLVVLEERNLDLLQGLLVYIAWSVRPSVRPSARAPSFFFFFLLSSFLFF